MIKALLPVISCLSICNYTLRSRLWRSFPLVLYVRIRNAFISVFPGFLSVRVLFCSRTCAFTDSSGGFSVPGYCQYTPASICLDFGPLDRLHHIYLSPSLTLGLIISAVAQSHRDNGLHRPLPQGAPSEHHITLSTSCYISLYTVILFIFLLQIAVDACDCPLHDLFALYHFGIFMQWRHYTWPWFPQKFLETIWESEVVVVRCLLVHLLLRRTSYIRSSFPLLELVRGTELIFGIIVSHISSFYLQ